MNVSSDSFKDRLRQAIGERSVNSFAKECCTSEGAIRNYLKGATTPDLTTLQKIADVSGCSLAWLASGEGEMRRGEGAPEQQEAAHVLDLELMEDIIARTIKAHHSTGVDYEDLAANSLAVMTATSIVNQYRAEKGLPSPSSNEILNNYNKMFTVLNEQLTAIADKRDKEKEG